MKKIGLTLLLFITLVLSIQAGYVGGKKDGLMHGKRTLTLENGDKYEGNYEAHMPNRINQ